MIPNSSFRLAILCLLFASSTFDQTFAQDIECDCEQVFDEMIEKLEANYIGLRHFQAQGKGPEYEERKSTFASRSQTIRGSECAAFLQEFLDYFEDGHLSVIERPVYEGELLDSINSKIASGRKTVEELKALLAEQKRTGSDPVIGTYRDQTSHFILIEENGEYRLYITETKNEQAKAGEIKAVFNPVNGRFRGTYYSYGHVPRFLKGGLFKDGTMLRLESMILIKTDSDLKRELDMVNFENTDWPTIQKLDDGNVLLYIPRFSVDFQVWKQLVDDNLQLLKGARNLIIDIRGNRGGNAIYFNLFNLFADSEMPGGQGHVLASADNKAYFERNLRFSKKIYQPVVNAIEQNMGEIVPGPIYPKRNYKRRKSSQIENVAILTDGACMSAAESFIMHSRQNSSLVKTFGSPTNGVIDYTSVNSVTLSSGRQNIYFAYPTSTLHQQIPDNGYNKTGMIPDVPIDAKVKDKVAFIMEYFKKK